MKYIVQAVEERRAYVEYLQERIPDLIVYYDRDRCAAKAFIETMRLAEGESHIHLEDDVFVVKDFCARAEEIVSRHSDHVINFFPGYKGVDRPPGEYRVPSRLGAFLYAVYVPGNIVVAMVDDWDVNSPWDYLYMNEHDKRFQLVAARLMKKQVMVYPALVQHRFGKSVINPTRSRFRQTEYFKG